MVQTTPPQFPEIGTPHAPNLANFFLTSSRYQLPNEVRKSPLDTDNSRGKNLVEYIFLYGRAVVIIPQASLFTRTVGFDVTVTS